MTQLRHVWRPSACLRVFAIALFIAACSTKEDGPAATGADGTASDGGATGSAPATTTTGTASGSPNASETGSEPAPTATTDLDPTGATGASANSTDASGDDSSSTTSDAHTCDPQPWFECSQPWDCRGRVAQDVGVFSCERLTSFFDEDGCPRQLCTEDADCPAGRRCHDPIAEECFDGGCLVTDVGCGEGPNGQGRTICGCGGSGACGSRVCVPEDEFPVGNCDPVGA